MVFPRPKATLKITQRLGGMYQSWDPVEFPLEVPSGYVKIDIENGNL